MGRLRRIAVRLLIGFLIMGIILLASLIFTQANLPRVSLKTIANNTIIISIGNSTVTMRVQSNQTAPVNNTHA
ncbi:MAG: hypothetical protein RXN91_09800 [Caldivirga sp.]|jgi:hypothetical protein